jgi:hypothetical protein
MPNKTKKPNLLPDDDDEPTELSLSTLKVVKPTISPVKVKVEKMGNEVEVTKKELKNKKRMTSKGLGKKLKHKLEYKLERNLENSLR